MFTLRRISGDGVEMNHILGNGYTFIHKLVNEDEFKKTFAIHFKKELPKEDDNVQSFDDENCYAFVSGQNGSYIQPLYKNQKNFIMTSDGTTFDNVSYR